VDVTKTILNVDDHAPARYVRTRILQKAGYGVDEADNGAVAIELASQAALVLLDVRLPDADGFSVCEQMKKAAPALPVVMVTSVYRTAQARRDAFAVGADAFLLEPVAPEQLVRTVEGLLNRPADTRLATTEVWILTDGVGNIDDLSADATKLLNLSARGARGRSLPGFFVDNRAKLITEVQRASEGLIIDRMGTLQPRDRKPIRVHLDVSPQPHEPGERVQLRWIISPESR